MCYAAHDQIIYAHAVGKPDSFILQRHIVVMIVSAEEAFRAAERFCGIKKSARVFRTADLTVAFLFIDAEEIFNFITILLIQFVSGSVLLQRDVEKYK